MLDKLKALFIVQEEAKVKSKKNKKSGASEETVDFTGKEQSNAKIFSEADKTVNNDIMTELLKILNDNNQEGFDYLEYKNAIKSLSSMQMDEKTRFRSAFATAKTMGVTVPKLLNSIGFYQRVLNDEQKKFTKSLKNNKSTNLSLAERKEYVDLIELKTKEVKKLTKEIANLKGVIHGTNPKGYSSDDFEKTANKLIQEMREDIKKINKFLS